MGIMTTLFVLALFLGPAPAEAAVSIDPIVHLAGDEFADDEGAAQGVRFAEAFPRIEAEVNQILDPGTIVGAILVAAAGLEPEDNMVDEPVRNASFVDLINAMLKYSPVQVMLNDLRAQVLGKVKRDWTRLERGEQVAFVSFTVPVAAGLVTGLISDPKALRAAQDLASGPLNSGIQSVIPGLDVRFNVATPSKSVMVTYDFAPLLRRHGFPL